MASEIRVDKINSLSGVGTVTLSPTGVDIAGITTVATFKVGTGVTVSSDGDIFTTGVTTSTSFSGSGANLTSLPVQVTLNNNADNRVITGGSGVNLYAESGFTFDGTDVQIPDKILLNTSGTYVKSNQLQFKPSGTAYIDHATTGQDIQIRMSTSSSLDTTGPTIKSTGNIAFASGKGINFSATSDASGASSEVLDDYEEGTWSPAVLAGTTNTQTFDSQGRYTKIGRMVYCQFLLQYSGAGNGAHVGYSGLPFTSVNNTSKGGGTVLFTNIPGLADFDAITAHVTSNASSIYLYYGMDSNATTGSGGFTNKAIYVVVQYEAA